MTEQRYKEIDLNDSPLTNEEIENGWHFCPDCDYLLTNDCCLDRKETEIDLDKEIQF